MMDILGAQQNKIYPKKIGLSFKCSSCAGHLQCVNNFFVDMYRNGGVSTTPT